MINILDDVKPCVTFFFNAPIYNGMMQIFGFQIVLFISSDVICRCVTFPITYAIWNCCISYQISIMCDYQINAISILEYFHSLIIFSEPLEYRKSEKGAVFFLKQFQAVHPFYYVVTMKVKHQGISEKPKVCPLFHATEQCFCLFELDSYVSDLTPLFCGRYTS